jgi:hypothetical protein
MKVRTLRMKDGFKEFAMFDEEGILYTSETPQLLPPTATMEGLIKCREMEDFEDYIDFNRLEIVEFDMIELNKIESKNKGKISVTINRNIDEELEKKSYNKSKLINSLLKEWLKSDKKDINKFVKKND